MCPLPSLPEGAVCASSAHHQLSGDRLALLPCVISRAAYVVTSLCLHSSLTQMCHSCCSSCRCLHGEGEESAAGLFPKLRLLQERAGPARPCPALAKRVDKQPMACPAPQPPSPGRREHPHPRGFSVALAADHPAGALPQNRLCRLSHRPLLALWTRRARAALHKSRQGVVGLPGASYRAGWGATTP